jgi:hypothetical protein
LGVLVERTERALLGAALTLGAALQIEGRRRGIAPAWVHGQSQGGLLDGLDGFEGRALAVDATTFQIAGCTQATGGVDAGAAGFVGKADEVRIGKAVFEWREIGTLPVGQAENLGAFVGAETCDGCVEYLGVAVTSGEPLARVLELSDGGTVGGHGHHAGGKHHQIHFQLDVVAELAFPHAD